jgi:hypothetical protein
VANDNGTKGTFEKVVTHEAVLFAYRFITGAAAIMLVAKATAIDANQEAMRKDIGDLKYNCAQQLAENTARVSVLTVRVDAHARQLDGFGNDIRDVNKRISEWLFGKTTK